MIRRIERNVDRNENLKHKLKHESFSRNKEATCAVEKLLSDQSFKRSDERMC